MTDQISWLRDIISAEIVQKREEGCDPTRIEERLRSREAATSEELVSTWLELFRLRPATPYPYVEPSDLDGILAESEGAAEIAPPRRRDLKDRMLGAWLGRCAGCLLGKPVEGWHRKEIRDFLVSEKAYPLRGYIPKPSRPHGKLRNHALVRGGIRGMVRDDDIDYTILGLHILKTYGTDATSEEIAREWLDRLQYGCVYTAERVAYRNLVNLVPIPETATYLNPYREWIGAQIRADAWGYAFPGRPRQAAELAFRDARISHVRNGIYGEMMASAMVAAAFSLDDPVEVVKTGLACIPRRSRLHEAVSSVLELSRKGGNWGDCWARIDERYGGYHGVHTLNNAAVVAMALLYGGRIFGDTLGIAVMGGWDTDCNGATAGSILGAMVGVGGIPAEWRDPLRDRVESYVRGYQSSRISGLAAETARLAVARATGAGP